MTCTNMMLSTGCSTAQGHNRKHTSHKPLPGDRAGLRVSDMDRTTVAPDMDRTTVAPDMDRTTVAPDIDRTSHTGQHWTLGTLSV